MAALVNPIGIGGRPVAPPNADPSHRTRDGEDAPQSTVTLPSPNARPAQP